MKAVARFVLPNFLRSTYLFVLPNFRARPMFERQIPDFFSDKLQIRQNSVPLVTSVRSSKVKFGWTGLLSSYFPLAISLLSPCYPLTIPLLSPYYRLTSFHLIWLYLAYSLHIPWTYLGPTNNFWRNCSLQILSYQSIQNFQLSLLVLRVLPNLVQIPNYHPIQNFQFSTFNFQFKNCQLKKIDPHFSTRKLKYESMNNYDN